MVLLHRQRVENDVVRSIVVRRAQNLIARRESRPGRSKCSSCRSDSASRQDFPKQATLSTINLVNYVIQAIKAERSKVGVHRLTRAQSVEPKGKRAGDDVSRCRHGSLKKGVRFLGRTQVQQEKLTK